MGNDRISFYLNGTDINCEVVRDLNHYSIYIKDIFQGILEKDDDLPKWVQVSGEPIPPTIVDEIGEKIERNLL